MGKTWLKVVLLIVALAFAYFLATFWQQLRPDDDFNTILGVGVLSFVSCFISLFFMTKGSGGD